MADQAITAAQAHELHMHMCRTHALVGWVVTQNSPQYSDKFIARLVTDSQSPEVLVAVRLVTNSQSPYVLVADSVEEIHRNLPPGLVRMEPQTAYPQGVLELWVMVQGPSPSSSESTSTGTFEHAMSLLTAMSTATQLFVGLTGAAWAVLVPNTMALPTFVVALALALHALLGFVVFLVLRGLGANMEQRLNVSRWKEYYGERRGIGEAAWFGVPTLYYGIGKTGFWTTAWFAHKAPQKLKDKIKGWSGNANYPPAGQVTPDTRQDDNIIDPSYAIARYPTLRIQRHAWPLVPLAAAICSVVLCVYTLCNGVEYAQVCNSRFTLLQQASTPLDLDRARYLLDKANCNVRTQTIPESQGHQAACNERFALLRQAATPLDLNRARYLLDKANCDVSTQLLPQLPLLSLKNIPKSVP